MRKLSIALVLFLLLASASAQQSKRTVTVAGCVMSVNGELQLLTSNGTYILKGKHDTVLGYNGKQVEVVGTVDGSAPAQGVPLVLHVTKVKKLADFCQ